MRKNRLMKFEIYLNLAREAKSRFPKMHDEIQIFLQLLKRPHIQIPNQPKAPMK